MLVADYRDQHGRTVDIMPQCQLCLQLVSRRNGGLLRVGIHVAPVTLPDSTASRPESSHADKKTSPPATKDTLATRPISKTLPNPD